MKRLLHEEVEGVELYYRDDTHDHSMLEEVWKEKCYSKFFPFGKKAIIIDIGAHNGYFSAFASKNTLEGSKIYAYEPVEENYNILRKNLNENGFKNVEAQNLGISKCDETITLYVNTAHTGGHSIYKERVEKYDVESIEELKLRCTAFKDSIPHDIKKVDYCKIDCEGAEFDILLNTPKEFLKKVSIYAMEFHEFGGNKVGQLETLFKGLGYSVEYSYSPSKRGISFGNFLAWRK